MAARAYWQGQIRLALVSIPVELYPATKSGAKISFQQVHEPIRDRLEELGLVSFAMLSGGKSVHVVVPLDPDHDWETHKDFARHFAEALALAEPDRFTATMSKARCKGKIFIDWLHNQRGATAIVAYSARAREGAPVAVPITWEELKKIENAHPFSIGDARKLLARAEDKKLSGWGFAAQGLPGV